LGPYQITALLGEGGMGQVYRARDTKLNRDVALKVLPDSFATDPDRLARFQREAQVLASLNHPNIAHIHGLEDSGGIRALVMELVEGEDLAQRLTGRAIPIDEALPIAKQIAEALEAAHEQGVIHRDLKPANIKVRPDGTVKVLDFGLAKAMEPAVVAPNVSQSPTITSPAMTQAGMILGTAAYMSPEQVVGKPVDKRTDLWSFGVVFLEMLTGRQVFHGETVSHVLASVLRDEPDWAALPSTTPTSIRRVLRRCLQKERKRRIADASDVRLDIEETLTGTSDLPGPAVVVRRPPLWKRAAMPAATVVIAALIGGALVWSLSRPALGLPVVRTTISTSGAVAGVDPLVAITPDGSRVVYHGSNQLYVRALNQLEPTVLSGVGAPRGIFVSPDGQWIGFFDGIQLRKVALTGGPPVTICPVDGPSRGASWGPDGTIIFATGNPASGLRRVSAAGGDPMVLTKPDRANGASGHWWPEFLPGGKAVLFTILPVTGRAEDGQIAVLDLRTATSKVLIRGGSQAHYVPTGHLVYGVAGTLRAVAFDLERLEIVGTGAPVLEGVRTTALGAVDAAIAANGSLLYIAGGEVGRGRDVVSVDRQGHAAPLAGIVPDQYRQLRLSPDGTRLALATSSDVWIYDLARATLSRLTTNPAADTRPLWTPDGSRIVFTSDRAGYLEIFSRSADGAGGDERLLTRDRDLVDLHADGWSADGRQLLFTEVHSNAQCAIGLSAVERQSDVKLLVKNEFCNDDPAVSSDGRWMAYQSNLSGQNEIYVERYPELGNRQQISTGGGVCPLWSRDGHELFFSTATSRQLLAVPVQSATTLTAGRANMLFEFAMLPPVVGNRPYDIGRDGRFYFIRSGETNTGAGALLNMILVQNWTEELKRRVPTR
jgi:eukaryotic-like serine/threonine-protein kinase